MRRSTWPQPPHAGPLTPATSPVPLSRERPPYSPSGATCAPYQVPAESRGGAARRRRRDPRWPPDRPNRTPEPGIQTVPITNCAIRPVPHRGTRRDPGRRPVSPWAGGLHTAQLFREISERGYAGSYPVVRDYLSQNSPAREPLPPAPPTVRDVTNWLCRRPDTLTEDEKTRLAAILDRCPELRAASDQVRAFAAMITGLTGENLPQWIDTARAAGLPGIASFARSLEQDLDAVTNGLTMP
jgi:hypothetical protein